MTNNIKLIGVVGAGQMGQGIVSQISKQENMHLVFIVDRNEKKIRGSYV